MVGVQVALGGFDRLVPEDLLEHMERDAGVGHPGCSGVAEPVAREVVEAELCHEVVPVGGVADRRCSEDAAARPPQERVVGLFPSGETFENGFESAKHRDRAVSATLGLFDDETASAGVVLASDPDDVVVPVQVTCPQSCDFGTAGCQEGGQHDVIGVGLVHFPTGGREVLQRREIGERVLSERSGGLGDTCLPRFRRARCLAGLMEMMSSRNASSRPRTSGAIKFLIVEAECSVSQVSVVRSIIPAVIFATRMCPSAGSTRSRRPVSYSSAVEMGSRPRCHLSPIEAA